MIAPDPRGIDVAIAAYFGALLSGETREAATRNAEGMLELFGFERRDSDAMLARKAEGFEPRSGGSAGLTEGQASPLFPQGNHHHDQG